jgi:hypothetical protein
MKDPKNTKSICEHRLIRRETVAKEKWFLEQIDFLEKSLAANTMGGLWQAYCVSDAGRTSFHD